MNFACLNSVLHVKVVVAAFNQEKALVGAFSVIANLRMDLRFKLHWTLDTSVITISPWAVGRAGSGVLAHYDAGVIRL